MNDKLEKMIETLAVQLLQRYPHEDDELLSDGMLGAADALLDLLDTMAAPSVDWLSSHEGPAIQ